MQRFHEKCCPSIECDKEAGGATWYIAIGIVGSLDRVHVNGLTREQAEGLCEIIRRVNESSVKNAQTYIKEAIGVGNI